MEDQCHREHTIPRCRPSPEQLGKGDFCFLSHPLFPRGTAPCHSALSPTGAQHRTRIRVLPEGRSAGGAAQTLPQRGAQAFSPAQQICEAGPGPPSHRSAGHKPPAGTAAPGRSYFAKSDELKVTLKMEGNRSVTYGLLIALTTWFLHGSLSNAGTLSTVNGASTFVWLRKTQGS